MDKLFKAYQKNAREDAAKEGNPIEDEDDMAGIEDGSRDNPETRALEEFILEST